MNAKIFRVRRFTSVLLAGGLFVAWGATLAGCDPVKPAANSATNTGTTGDVTTLPPGETQNPVVTPPSPGQEQTDERTVRVYEKVNGPEGERLESKQIPVPPEQAKSPATFALNAMASEADSPLPTGTKVKSVKVEGDLATVDFSPEFKTNFKGGDQYEAVVFNAVTETLGQFPNVKRVQILVDGKKEAIGGLQDTTEPLEVGTPKVSNEGDATASAIPTP